MMADVTVSLRWRGEGLEFEGGAPGGGVVRLDGSGGCGPTPMQLLLLSLAGCTAVDVVDILRKMRVSLGGLEVRVEGDRACEAPRRYTRIRLVYEVQGLGVGEEEKVRRAIALSHEKYCSVLHTLRPDVEVRSELVVA